MKCIRGFKDILRDKVGLTSRKDRARDKVGLKGRIKKVGVLGLAGVCLVQSLVSTVDFAQASNFSMLGTNSALGSPVLNGNFESENWNRWEMLTWGIFLSNFPTPIVDDYESAFNTNSGKGSKGAGLKALQFGSGSGSDETLTDLLKYAVGQQQKAGTQQLYVAYTPVARDSLKRTVIDSNTDKALIRPATFKDLFLASKAEDGDSWVKLSNVDGSNNPTTVPIDGSVANKSMINNATMATDEYLDMVTLEGGSLPTFYIEYGGNYEPVLDYTDSWDAQILTAFVARTACGEYSKEFMSTFNDMWAKSDTLNVALDCFGNIITEYDGSRRVIIPASINQHLTSSPKINLLSSMIFNGLQSGVNGEELVLRGQQSVGGWFGLDSIAGIINLTDIRYGGLPALGSHLDGIKEGTISLYYDLDTIMYNTYYHGGEAANGTKTVNGEAKEVNNTHYGKAVKQLFDLDATKSTGNGYTLKIEAANMDKAFEKLSFTDKKSKECLANMVQASGEIANIAGTSTDKKILNNVIFNNGVTNLFDEGVIVPVQMDVGRTDGYLNNAGAGRMFIQHLYEGYKKSITSPAGDVGNDYINTIMSSDQTAKMKDFSQAFTGAKDGKISKILASFVSIKTELFKLNISADKLVGATMDSASKPFLGMGDTKVDGSVVSNIGFSKDGDLDFFPGRLIKAYPVSDTMLRVGNVLGIREGTEFATYSPAIYATYLDWYGISMDKINNTGKSDFNSHIFDGKSDTLNVDINAIADVKSAADKKEEVLNYTYMMLNPTEGKSYRNEIMNSFITNFIYDNYQKTVYGNSSSFYNTSSSSKLATRSGSGFLTLKSYSDNFMTSGFLKVYSRIAIIIIAIAFILIILNGLLKGRKLSWFIISLTVIINTILIVPSLGDVTPVIANSIVQKLYNSKMTYWAISEAVTNANMEKEYVNSTTLSTGYLGDLSKDEQSKVISLVKTLNTVYLDRELMVKSDISKKVTGTQGGNYDKIQTLRSARWMLPTIMRQFTASDGSADYVYLPLGDVYDDLSNMYWLYNPEDAKYTQTVNGQQSTVESNSVPANGTTETTEKAANTEEAIKVTERKKLFPDYIDTSIKNGGSDIQYRAEAYYRGKSMDELSHTYSYLLKSTAVPLNRTYGFGGQYKNLSSYDDYVDSSNRSGKAQEFLQEASVLELDAGKYNRESRATVKQSYGYLWATENPYHYFYGVIKDSFNSDSTLGAIVGKLQGQYNEVEDFGEVRTSFMHSGETGYIRDVADLQEMFTNMLPYLYQMQITAGGMDGKSGVLGDTKIENYTIYKNNYKAWLFRSNWATKIMESPELTKATTVRDADGNKVQIANPTLVSSYPTNRPMIFSEAQMHAEGLMESDLSLVELKAIKVNKDVARRWTLLLNYVNSDGMTKEVLLRQMSTEAIMSFNAEYSPSGLFNNAFNLYPDGLDLRDISFDSIMKMLMLNVTQDTSYIYGDTMQNIVRDSDIISAIFLLVAAFLCATIVPFVRNVAMGLIFYLGFCSIIYALLASNKSKVKVSCGYLISNIIFLVVTVIYYGTFSLLMAVTTNDAVLTVQSVQVNTGNPVVCFIVIILVSCLYIASMGALVNFCFKHYRDMGMEVYASIAGIMTDKLSGGLNGIMDKVSNIGSDKPSPTQSKKLRKSSKMRKDSEGNSDGGSNGGTNEGYKATDKDKTDSSEYDSKTYSNGDADYDDSADTEYIDKEIEKGKQRQQKDKKQEDKE